MKKENSLLKNLLGKEGPAVTQAFKCSSDINDILCPLNLKQTELCLCPPTTQII